MFFLFKKEREEPETFDYINILLAAFDLCIDKEHFKKVDYAIDFYQTAYSQKNGGDEDVTLSSNLNYMCARNSLEDIYIDIYEKMKYGNFYDIQYTEDVISGGYKQKYLKYKQKYLQLKKNNLI